MSERQDIIRIVIADDHPIFREGLRKLLETEPGFSVVGVASDGLEVIQHVRETNPDVLLLDVAMPRMNGLEVLKTLANEGAKVSVVLLTASIEPDETVLALRLGARGVVLKESATQLLFKCIRSVVSGELWVGHDSIADIVDHLRQKQRAAARNTTAVARLTPRELEVVAAIVDGATNKDISQQFGLSEQTVKNHLSHIFDKLGVSNRLELALYALHHRMLSNFDRGGERG